MVFNETQDHYRKKRKTKMIFMGNALLIYSRDI